MRFASRFWPQEHRKGSAALLLFLVSGCWLTLAGCTRIPPNYSYERIPERFEEKGQLAEVTEVDNCESDLALERSISQSVQLGETIVLEEEQVKSVASAAGVSAGGGISAGAQGIGGQASVEARLLTELKSEAIRRFGAGLESGRSRTDSISVFVNPHRKAIVSLQWVETWEHGHFVVSRDGTLLGDVSYSLLKDIRLDARVQSLRCGPVARVWSGILRVSNQSKFGQSPMQLLVAVQAAIIVALAGGLILSRSRRRDRSRVKDDDEYGRF